MKAGSTDSAGRAGASGHVPTDSYHESGTVEAWNHRYATRGMVWGTAPNQFLADYATGLTPRRVLDLGCGQGRNAVWLAKQGHSVTGIDHSDVGIDQARRLAADQMVEVTLETANVVGEWVPPAEAFDLVILSYLQLPPHDRRVAHAKAVAAVAPGAGPIAYPDDWRVGDRVSIDLPDLGLRFDRRVEAVRVRADAGEPVAVDCAFGAPAPDAADTLRRIAERTAPARFE